MPTSPGTLSMALGALWDHVRAHHKDLPAARIALSPTPPSSDHGWGRWSRGDDDLVTGLIVCAAVLQEGEEATLRQVLHDAAHLLNWARETPDTTRRGTYHNRAFMRAAEEVGLQWPEGRSASHLGYPDPGVSDVTRKRYADDLAAIARAIPDALPHLALPESRSSHGPSRVTAACKCDPPRKFQMSPGKLDLGPITCGICGGAFEPVSR
jgi:hypothetical protein